MKEIKLFLIVFAAILAAVAVLGISQAFFDAHRMQVHNQILREEADRMEQVNDEMLAELWLPAPPHNASDASCWPRCQTTPAASSRH